MSSSTDLNILSNNPYVNSVTFSDDWTTYKFNKEFFVQDNLLGSSQYSVYKCKYKIDGREYFMAGKKIPIKYSKKGIYKYKKIDDDHIKKISKEIDVLRSLISENSIVKFYGSFLEEDQIWIFMELMEGTLGDLIQRSRASTSYYFAETLDIMYSTASSCLSAIEFCHKKGFKHGDIKPGNILFNKQGQMKLCDFGETSKVDENFMSGTLIYWSPERFQKEKLSSGSSEIWSLGMTMLEIFYGKNPVLYYNKLTDFYDLMKF